MSSKPNGGEATPLHPEGDRKMTKVMSERKVDYVLDGKLVCKLTVPESAKVLTYHKKKSHKAVMEIGRKLTVDTPNKDKGGLAMAVKMMKEAKAKEEMTTRKTTPKRKTSAKKPTAGTKKTAGKAKSTTKANGAAKKPAAKKKTPAKGKASASKKSVAKKEGIPPQWFYDLAKEYKTETVEKKGKVVIKVDGTNKNWLSYVKKSGEWCFVLDLSGKEQVSANDPKAETKVAAYMKKTKTK